MSTTLLVDVVIALAVLGLLLARQLRTRPISDRNARIMVILGVVGGYEVIQFADKTPVPAAAWPLLAVSLATAAGFGVLRGTQMHVWNGPDGALRRGNLTTCVLWVVGIAIHLLVDTGGGALFNVPSGFGTASLMLYIAVTLGVQQLVLAQRAQRLSPSSPLWPAL
jgi:hypothetical protein